MKKIFTITLLSIISWQLMAQVQFVSKLIEYKPAPGQFINTGFGTPEAAKEIVGGIDGLVSLGYFGGYITVGFDKPVKNHPDNPYGVDFTIFGNAFNGNAEPGVVMVMKDENNNGKPDDTWYELKGSNHFLSSTVTNYEITYANPEDSVDVPWTDNQEASGVVKTNSYHKQPYYPKAQFFPEINQEKYTLAGSLIKSRNFIGTFSVSCRYDYGYADNLPKVANKPLDVPDNPYTLNVQEGCGGDAFDIDWAVDADGNFVDLDEISFVKIYTGVAKDGGAIGEISTDIRGISVVKPNADIKGITDVIVSNIPPLKPSYPPKDEFLVEEKTDFQFEAYVVSKGKLNDNQNIVWQSSDETIATIDETGKVSALKTGEVIISAHWAVNEAIKRAYKIIVTPYTSNNLLSKQIDFTVYPNPAKNYLNLQHVQGASIKIISITGVVVKQIYCTETHKKLDISELKPGIYLINYQKDTLTKTIRLIKI